MKQFLTVLRFELNNYFKNKSFLLTTIILIMLWLYGCMYIILLGGEMNAILEEYTGKWTHSEKRNE